jgi:hypothetical protein
MALLPMQKVISTRIANIHADCRNHISSGDLLETYFADGLLVGLQKVQVVITRKPERTKMRSDQVTARDAIHGEILKHVARGSKLYTDEAGHYLGLPKSYTHAFVN